MVLESEKFYDGDRQSGVLLRDVRDDEIATLIAFTLDADTTYRADQLTEIGPGPTEWTAFRFSEALSGTVTEGVRTEHGVSVDGVVLDGAAVPSYLAHRILVDLARRSGDRAEFRQVNEGGEPEVHDVEIVRRDPDDLVLPGEGSVSADRYDLLLDGEPYTSHWWDGDAVVASDWTAGSMSVRVPDLEAALDDCPVQVARIAREWVAGRHIG